MTFDSDFYKNIIDNLPEGIAICNSKNIIIEANKNLERLTGYEKQDLLGKNISLFVRSTQNSCPRCAQEAGEQEQHKTKSYYLAEMIDRAENLTCIRVNSSITKNGQTIYLIIPLADVAFLNQAHIDFVSTVSHELRTPLTSIKGFADTLLTAGEQLNKEQQTRFISIIKSQVDRLTRLVENLLTVSKLESKKDKSIYKAIELKKFVESIVYSIQPKAKEHNIEMEVMPNLPPIWADSDKLEQVLTNIIDNAIKYSNKGSTVRIEIFFSHEGSDLIQIKVKDQGVGIPEEHLSKIFTKFSRIDNPLTRHVQGTGLGLYITKSIVENMGGKISVSSNSDGSIFTVTFPVATHEKPAQMKF